MKRTSAIVLGLVSALMAATAASAVLAGDQGSERVPGARELEGRLIAPCCWTQTLDIHDSPIAEQLRAEISQRLRAGEPAAKIEDDLAARYSEKIRAVPRGEDPRLALPLIVGGAMGVAVVWLTWIGVSWLRRNRNSPASAAVSSNSSSTKGTEQYDKRLDAELEHLSDVS